MNIHKTSRRVVRPPSDDAAPYVPRSLHEADLILRSLRAELLTASTADALRIIAQRAKAIATCFQNIERWRTPAREVELDALDKLKKIEVQS